jgi:putative tricarboxylic transport membrane protein
LKKIDLISGLVILIIATLYLRTADKLAFWKGKTLGPGFFPFLLGIALVALTILLLINTILAYKKNSLSPPEGFFPSRSGGLKLLYVIVALVLYVLTFQPLGYVLSTLLFLSVLFFAWDARKPWLAIAMAAVTVLCSYVVFDLLLKVQLPRGFLG